MTRYAGAEDEAYARLIAARRFVSPEEAEADLKRSKRERENALIRRRLPRVA